MNAVREKSLPVGLIGFSELLYQLEELIGNKMTSYIGLILALVSIPDGTDTQEKTKIALPATVQRNTNQAGDKAILPVSLKVAVKALSKSESGKAAKSGDAAETKKPEIKASGKNSKDKVSATGKKDAKPTPRKPLRRRVLVFKAEWCGACQLLNNEWPALRKVRWRIGSKNTDHFQLIDVDRQPALMNKYRISSLPTVILLDGDKELDRRGVLGAVDLAELYYGRLK